MIFDPENRLRENGGGSGEVEPEPVEPSRP
jgi:hypothetical protein